MKIFLKAYIKKNLGDDIFIKIISERYPDFKFYLPDTAKYLKMDNLVFYSQKNNKLLKILSFGRLSKDIINMKKCDFSVIIGGSMFIEKNDNIIKKIISSINYIPPFDYIIGINFGPYQSNQYYRRYLNNFKKSKYICFREKKSYDLFSTLNNTSFAPDIIFNLDLTKYINKSNKSIVISVIDCNTRFNNDISENYYAQILKIIHYYHQLNYNIYLMSFCKSEGDERAIDILKPNIPSTNVSFFNYDGNIDEALDIISKCKIIVGSRFHANILGLLFNKIIIPFAYNDKIINVLSDLNYKGKIYDIRKKDIVNEKDLKKINNSNLDIDKIVKLSSKHFKGIDEYIKGELKDV